MGGRHRLDVDHTTRVIRPNKYIDIRIDVHTSISVLTVLLLDVRQKPLFQFRVDSLDNGFDKDVMGIGGADIYIQVAIIGIRVITTEVF